MDRCQGLNVSRAGVPPLQHPRSEALRQEGFLFVEQKLFFKKSEGSEDTEVPTAETAANPTTDDTAASAETSEITSDAENEMLSLLRELLELKQKKTSDV